MKWDDSRDRIDYYRGTSLVNTYKTGTCAQCGQPTQWMDLNLMIYLCSTECTEARWHERFDELTK